MFSYKIIPGSCNLEILAQEEDEKESIIFHASTDNLPCINVGPFQVDQIPVGGVHADRMNTRSSMHGNVTGGEVSEEVGSAKRKNVFRSRGLMMKMKMKMMKMMMMMMMMMMIMMMMMNEA